MSTSPSNHKKLVAVIAMALTCGICQAGPYVGIENVNTDGPRTSRSYHSTQTSGFVGYNFDLVKNWSHSVEYDGKLGSASGIFNGKNSETVVSSITYRINYKDAFVRVGYVKLDIDDDDIERVSDRARSFAIGTETQVHKTANTVHKVRLILEHIEGKAVDFNTARIGYVVYFK